MIPRWQERASNESSGTPRRPATYGAHKTGPYFAMMQEPWRSRKDCPTCGVVETLDHSLLECPDSKQRVLWRLASDMLQAKRV